MKWYRNLYLGENAAKQKYKVFGRVRKGRFQLDTYLITISTNSDNLLEIIHANILKQPYYKKKGRLKDLYVVGIAQGYSEALELVRTIIDEVYQKTKGLDITEYLKFGQKIKHR